MFTSLELINNIYHRQLILRTNYDSIHTNHVILISSHFIIIYIFSTILFHFYIIFMLISNWYMINTFVLNLGTATVFIFVICKLTYCIEFTKFVYLIFSFFDQ